MVDDWKTLILCYGYCCYSFSSSCIYCCFIWINRQKMSCLFYLLCYSFYTKLEIYTSWSTQISKDILYITSNECDMNKMCHHRNWSEIVMVTRKLSPYHKENTPYIFLYWVCTWYDSFYRGWKNEAQCAICYSWFALPDRI